MDALDVIREALAALPARCRYHGDDVIDHRTMRFGPGPHPCCDTGRPSLLRQRAEQALRELELKEQQ